jgi:hypothetical protein
MNQATGLYHNIGKGEFEDATAKAGLMHERRFVSWGVGMFDLDNDSNPDIFLVTGQVYPELEHGDRASFFVTREMGCLLELTKKPNRLLPRAT